MSDRKVIVLTGASGGVGRATARKLGDQGCRVALIARGRAGLDAAGAEVEERGGEAIAIPLDVSDHAAVESAASLVEETFGPIDVWINDAMVTLYADFLEIEPEEFRRSTEVTYLGTVWGTRAALRRMVPRDRGRVVQVGSAMAYRGIPLQAPYCGGKHAIKGFTESVITELLHRGSRVTVGMVQLPGLNTTQFTWGRTKLDKQTQPVPPIYEPEVAARAIVHSAFHARREMWVGAPTFWTILAERIAPSLVDRYLAKTGVSSQQTDHPLDPEGHDNLFEPVDEDRGAHGPFDDRAHQASPLLWTSRHRHAVTGAGVLAAGLAVAGAASRAGGRRMPRARSLV
jgi:NAD(P)-dependent dehydrogenase (short-subunit alcohol dehydrogenase family)